MLLAIDIGNTNMEFGIFDGDTLTSKFRLVTNRNTTADEVGLSTMQFFSIHGYNPKDVEDVIITSVVPQVMYSISHAMRKYLKKDPLIVGENLEIPIENRYDNPREVGADRLVNSYAAFRKYSGPLIVVDFGTATTFDVVSKDGAYLGGLIYPGIKISMDALFQNTAKLPRVELVKPARVIGKNTVDSMQAGAIYGYTGAVANILSEINRELGQAPAVIATGGLASMIGGQGDLFPTVDSSSTLEGLRMIYEHNRLACGK